MGTGSERPFFLIRARPGQQLLMFPSRPAALGGSDVKRVGRSVTTIVLVTALAMALSPQTPLGESLWPEPNHDERPEGAQVPFFAVMGLIQAAATGAGVAYLLFGWGLSKRFTKGSMPRAVALHASFGWLLANWWLHDTLHFLNGLDLTGLLLIDYAFHATMIASALVVGWTLAVFDDELDAEAPAVAGLRGRRTP